MQTTFVTIYDRWINVCVYSIPMAILLILIPCLVYSIDDRKALKISEEYVLDIRLDEESISMEDILQIRNTTYAVPDYEKWRVSIYESKIVDLNNDGRSDVVSLVNLKTSSDPVEIFIICSKDNGYFAQKFITRHANIQRDIFDTNKDGTIEIFTREIIPSALPRAYAFHWVNVFSYDNNNYLKSNKSFIESYYIQHYLPIIADRLKDASDKISVKNNDNKDIFVNEIVTGMISDSSEAIRRINALYNK